MPVMLNAQEPESTFFLDNYAYSYRNSPALSDTTTSGVAAVGAGHIGAAISSDLGIKNVMFPRNGNLVTGLNKDVSAEEFLSGLKENNHVVADIDWNLLSMTSRTDRRNRLVTFEINMKSHTDLSVPKELLAILKTGNGAGDCYEFPHAGAKSSTWFEISGGTEFRPGQFVIAFRTKLLLGGADARLRLDEACLSMSDKYPSLAMKASLLASKNTFSIDSDEKGYLDFGTFDYAGVTPAGYGAGLDLGVLWRPSPKWEVTTSVLDLGAIRWSADLYAQSAAYMGDGADGYVGDMTEFKIADTPHEPYTEMIPFTLNAGFRYKPANIVTVGARALWKHAGDYNVARITAGAGLNPCRPFGMGASVSYGTDGFRAAGSMCLRLAFVQFFLAAESSLTKFTYSHIPINPPGVTVSAGLSLAFKRKWNIG
mgnify:FL=1